MTSILTNVGAMVALQTMRGINQNLAQTQNEISTGKSVSNARDNAAVWAVSKTMESDVKGFNAIADSLALGRSTVGVGRQAAETVTDLLTQMQGRIVAAQEDNVDRAKIQNDVEALRQQIGAVVNAAQFNGLNLVRGTDTVSILSSLDRASNGTVSTSNIAVNRQDLSTDAAVFGSGATLADNFEVDGLVGTDIAAGGATEGNLTFGGALGVGEGRVFDISITIGSAPAIIVQSAALADGATAAQIGDAIRDAITNSGDPDLANIELTATGTGAEIGFTIGGTFEDVTIDLSDFVAATAVSGVNVNGWTDQAQTISAPAATVEFDSSADINAGDSYRVTIGGENFDFVASDGDDFEAVAEGLAELINAQAGFSARVTEALGTFTLEVINTSGSAASFSADGAEDGSAAGGLRALTTIDVSTADGAEAALEAIDDLIQTSINAAAAFGSVQGRIDTQAEFVQNLTDSLNTGIGSLVDANMEAASARLQALQVQQQLATQSLSIANQAPQNILALFR